MSTEPLNTLPIIQYLHQVKQADASRSQEIRIPIDRAKALAFTLGIVMSRLEGDLEQLFIKNNKSLDDTIEIKIDNGSNW